MAKSPYLTLSNLKGGINDSAAPFAIEDNQVALALNVDYRLGNIASKRGGCAPVSLTSSVFVRDVPVMRQRDQGGWTGASSGSIAVTAYGAAATNHFLYVSIGASASRTVSSVTLGGVALTKIDEQTAFTFTRSVWYLRNPSITGGTLAVTLSGSGDCRICAERWDNVDTAASPVVGTSTVDTNANICPFDTGNFSPKYMALNTLVWISANTATLQTSGVHSSAQGKTGVVNVASIAELGMKPITQFYHVFSGSTSVLYSVHGLLGVSITTGRPIESIMRFQPTNDATGDELWAQDDFGRLDRRVAGVWQGGVPAINYQVGSFLTGDYGTNATSLHGKFFLALGGTTYADRTHVWDGTYLRWAGLGAPPAPTAGDSGGVGTYASTRYFRIRYIEQSGSTILRRSEPSSVTTFTPSGANASALIAVPTNAFFAFPAIQGEGATHVEFEASMDNILFYRIATVQIVAAAAVWTDSTAAATGYSAAGTLSEALTEYNPLPGCRHVSIDEDRVLVGGSPFSAVNDSRVSWSVLTADTGVGNDERVPATQRHFINLDGLSGGRLTHMMPAVMAGILAFKLGRVYKLNRSGNPSKAYDSQQLTANRGCVPRGASDGTDSEGVPCVYFTDPNVGAVRFGQRGFEDLMQRRSIAARLNKAATVIARTLFYPKYWLTWFALALDGATVPNYICCYNVKEGTWTDYDGHMATAVSMLLFPSLTTQELRPLLAVGTVGTSYIVEADNGVNDDGTRFRGYVRSKAFTVGGLMREFEIAGGYLHAKVSTATVQVSAIRDLGLERKDTAAVSLIASAAGETYVSRMLDDLTIAELEQLQLELGDPVSYTGSQLEQTWTLESLVVKYGSGTEAGS